MKDVSRVKELARLFLKLGSIGFGGPAAHIAMMRDEVVDKKKWMSEQHFLDLVGATNLIPGPNSTEMAIHIGRERAGQKGLIIAGICFILPAVIITGIIAWFYKSYGQIPQVQSFVYGIKPAIIAVVLGAVIPLAKKSLKSLNLALIGILVLVLSQLNFSEALLIFGAGSIAILPAFFKKNKLNSLLPLALLQIPKLALLSSINFNLFWIFLKIGAILYGSGYVLFAFLDTELVSTGMLTHSQLLDAIAVGQFTPGPVFSAVTFVGYQINDLSGAAIATFAIFLPSFVFVALLNPVVARMRNSILFSTFLDAVNIASVAVIVSVCFTLGKEAIKDWRTLAIAFVSLLVVLLFKKLNTVWIIFGASVAGYLLALI